MHSSLVDGAETAGMPLDDRGLAYGDGLFETIAVIGGRPRLWQAHMDRLAEGCARLGIDMPPQETLLRDVQAVVTRDDPHAVVRLVLTRGSAGRGYRPYPGQRTRRLISAFGFPAGIEEAIRDGVEARILNLRLAHQPALGGIKHLNRLEQVLASMELDGGSGGEGILLDQDGYLVSAVSANLFVVSDGALLTPRMDRCGVRGVVRALILREHKARSELRRIHPAMLAEVEEVFITNAIRGVVPVTRIDAQQWRPGPVTRELQDWFRRRARAA